MREKFRLFCLIVCTMLFAFAFLASCTQDEKEEEGDNFETVPIEVTTDQMYDLAVGDQIGKVIFKQKQGAIGARVEAICQIESLSRFPDQRVDVKLELLNQDAAREIYDPIEWVQDTNEKTFFFIIPVVETIPSILNFRVMVYQYIYEDEAASTLDDDTAADDDTTDDDLTDDDVTDDDVTDDDAATDDDATDDDTAPTPSKTFEAEAVYLFIVSEGQPGTGD